MAGSKLEKKLKKIVRAHPDIVVHPYSPSGSFVRAVLFCDQKELLRGQVVWDNETVPARWVVRAYLEDPDGPLVVEHPASEGEIPGAITRVVRRTLRSGR